MCYIYKCTDVQKRSVGYLADEDEDNWFGVTLSLADICLLQLYLLLIL